MQQQVRENETNLDVANVLNLFINELQGTFKLLAFGLPLLCEPLEFGGFLFGGFKSIFFFLHGSRELMQLRSILFLELLVCLNDLTMLNRIDFLKINDD